MSGAGHLVARFFGSLRPGGPSQVDEAWAAAHLGDDEIVLWRRMSNADRRHAAGVARRVDSALGELATEPVLAAALLHDVGKVESGLGTFGRVFATLCAALGGRSRIAAGGGRTARYLRHDAIGAELLAVAGSDPLTVTWAAEHHRPASAWTLPHAVAAALKAADDD